MHMVTETDLTMEQAMSMLLTGGAVCPDALRYSSPEPSESAKASIVEEVNIEGWCEESTPPNNLDIQSAAAVGK